MKMKREFMVILVCLCLAFVLTAGCTTPVTTPVTTPAATSPVTPAATPAVTVMPDLVGNWTGISRGYVDASGYQAMDEAIRMNVTEQTGRLFKGQISFPENGTSVTKEVAGVLGADGKTIEDVEYPVGFSDGVVISADELELIFRDQGKPSTITIDSLKRSTASGKAATPAVQPVPVLLGKWNGSSVGYMDTSGYQVARDVMGHERHRTDRPPLQGTGHVCDEQNPGNQELCRGYRAVTGRHLRPWRTLTGSVTA